ncbi:Fe-S cluster assembly protein SufD [Pseudomonadota bacterium]|nr:Fe-S cluster assembly protein SufD [Pseudomonadota bacterium]
MKNLTELATPFASITPELGSDLAWLKSLRLKALTQFNSQGLPSKKEEDWKYTSLWEMAQQEFTHEALTSDVNEIQCDELALLEDSHRLVIVDGAFSEKLSKLDDLQEGVFIGPLSSEQGLAQAQPHIGQQIDISKAGLNGLNTLLMNDGFTVVIGVNVKVDKAIEVLVINTGVTTNLATHLRNVIVMAENSQATVIEHYATLSDAMSFTNVVSEVVLSSDAELNHYKLQQESNNAYHIATLAATQGVGSRWNTSSVALGGKQSRTDVHSKLMGKNSHTTMDGLYIATGEQHIDHHTRIDHLVPDTTSDELFKGVLDEQSHAVFNGKVIVHKDAQKTDANQQNHNLLLSRGCEIDTKPEMEIYADDVKSAHGSTVGQLNEDNLFFLRARGLDEVTARSLLTHAFAVDVLNRIPSEVIRTALSTQVEKHLPKGGKA